MINQKSTTSPVTYNLRKEERNKIDEMSAAKGISKSQIIRDAVRLYSIVNENLKSKKRLAFIDDKGNITQLEVLWNEDLSATNAGQLDAAAAVRDAIFKHNLDDNMIGYLKRLSIDDLIKLGRDKSVYNQN